MNFEEAQAVNPYAHFGQIAAEAPVAARSRFIKKTYLHLAAAVCAFMALEALFFSMQLEVPLLNFLTSGRFAYLLFFGGFVLASTMADRMARSEASVGMQYMGLSLYVLFEAVFFLPLLALAQGMAVDFEIIGKMGVIEVAAYSTLIIFGGLTAFVLVSKKDFSFMGTALSIAGFGIMALIVISMITGFQWGILFVVGMIVFASAYILYSTSNVLHHYRTEQHVAASLALFASLALLFWYVLQLVMSFSSRD